jgi:RNA polymerase sigma-70 factor (ECF subfamily)
MDEKNLLKLSREGDIEAFTLLLRSCENHLRRTAYALMADEADDLMQETFLAAFKNLKKFRMRSSFYTWTYRIMLNTAYKKFRKKKQKRLFLHRMDKRTANYNSDDSHASGAGKEKVRTAVAALPLKYKEIITLYYFEDFSIKEISEMLEISEGTVKSRLFNARTLLKKIIEPAA